MAGDIQNVLYYCLQSEQIIHNRAGKNCIYREPYATFRSVSRGLAKGQKCDIGAPDQ